MFTLIMYYFKHLLSVQLLVLLKQSYSEFTAI